jgi:hypothetical protein
VSLFDKSIKLESGLRRSNHIDHFISYKVEEYVNRIRKKTKIEKFNSCSPKDLGEGGTLREISTQKMSRINIGLLETMPLLKHH